MRTRWIGGLALAFVGGLALIALAEEVTLTTYYPAPRGVYSELRANQFQDATQPGNFYVEPKGSSKLKTLTIGDVPVGSTGTTINGDLVVGPSTTSGRRIILNGQALQFTNGLPPPTVIIKTVTVPHDADFGPGTGTLVTHNLCLASGFCGVNYIVYPIVMGYTKGGVLLSSSTKISVAPASIWGNPGGDMNIWVDDMRDNTVRVHFKGSGNADEVILKILFWGFQPAS